MRVIGSDGEQIGILPTEEARARADELGLDLVEVSPNSRPPVCRILDFGKYKYEVSKKEKVAKKKQLTMGLKEMRFRSRIDDHDFNFKVKHVRSFLEAGHKVKVFVMFRGREMARTQYGREILDRVAEELKDLAVVESPPRLEGRHMNMVMRATTEVIKKSREREAAKVKASEEAATADESVKSVNEATDVAEAAPEKTD